MDFESQIEKIAKDIRDREDKELALAFTNVIGLLLRDNGVFVKTSRNIFGTDKECDKNKYIIKKEYGISIDGLDFTEHDKVFEDKIELLNRNLNLQKDKRCEAEIERNYLAERFNQLKDENDELNQRIAELESKETEKPTKINLNETIKVKLTPYGAEIYYKQFDELNKQYERQICKPQMPRIDKDGYTEFQLWHFIELYGQHIGMCKQNVIEPLDIVYCGNDKYHSDNAE